MTVHADNQTGMLGAQLLSSVGVGGTVNLGTNWTGPSGTANLTLDPTVTPGVPNPLWELLQATVTNGSSSATITSRPNPLTHAAGAVWASGPVAADILKDAQAFSFSGQSSVTCNHNLNRYPISVLLLDGSQNQFVGGIAHPSTNQTVISFSAPQSGTVYIA